MSRILQIHDNNNYKLFPFDQGSLEEFDASIAHLTRTEQRRRRLDYLRESALQIKEQQSGASTLMIVCALIPVLWGFFIILWFLRRKAKAKTQTQLENALEYWGIHEVEIEAYVSDDLYDSEDLFE